MIPPRNPFYRDALAAPHEAYSRVEIWRGGVQVDELVQRDWAAKYSLNRPVFLAGNVRATLNSKVTRNLTLSVPDYLYPYGNRDLLAPFGNEIRAFRGIRYGNESVDEFPVFTGPIMRARPPSLGQCTVDALDVTHHVAAAGFSQPLPSTVGASLISEYERLVSDAYPSATFGRHDAITATVPALAYDSDRGDALDNLTKTANAFWYALAGGQFVLRFVPWIVRPVTGPIALKDGPGGTIIEAYPDQDASDLYNQYTVTSERADGGPNLYASAADDDPTSPTYVGGPFGRRSAKPIRVTGATNQGQLLTLARQLVARTRGLANSWSITCAADASIELGDPLDVTSRSHRAFQVVDSITMPLDPQAPMQISGRGMAAAIPGED